MGLLAHLFRIQPSELFAMDRDDLEFWRERADEVITMLEKKR